MGSLSSGITYSSTGAPQGTVLAPFLFTLYTSDCKSTASSCPLVKFADDSAMMGLINNDDYSSYMLEINHFVEYCDRNYLVLNVKKIKEMLIDFRRQTSEPDSVVIKGENRVSTYEYLGITVDSLLSWHFQIDTMLKKLHSRMYCLRKLRSFGVRQEILSSFYSAVISSVWSYYYY